MRIGGRSELRKHTQEGIWSKITQLHAGNADPLSGGRWNTESPWHKTMSLLRVSLVENRNGIQKERNALAVKFEKYGENSNYKEDGVGWL